MAENIRQRLEESDSVFDFGCGTGTYSIAIADKVKSIHATDISEKMLAIAGKRASSRSVGNIDLRRTIKIRWNILSLHRCETTNTALNAY